MNSNKKIAITAGILLIIATVVNFASVSFWKAVNAQDYLVKISGNETQIIFGAFLQIIASFACAGIAISLYPVLKKFSIGLALGAVGLRIFEGIFYIVGVVGVVLLLPLSQEFIKAGAPTVSYFQTIGTLLLLFRDWANLAGIMAFYLGASLYYWIFIRSKLIPRWLSIWGFIGVCLGMIACLLGMFKIIGYMSAPQIILNLPIGLQEMILAVWLIIKGFNQPVIASEIIKQN